MKERQKILCEFLFLVLMAFGFAMLGCTNPATGEIGMENDVEKAEGAAGASDEAASPEIDAAPDVEMLP
jgi:hypothetical protein